MGSTFGNRCSPERPLHGTVDGLINRQLKAASSPSTSTMQCRGGAVEQPLGSCSSTPGPDPLPPLDYSKAAGGDAR